MDRNTIQSRLGSLKQQETDVVRMLEQMHANLNAIRGAIQFAEDLLKPETPTPDVPVLVPDMPPPAEDLLAE